MESGFLNETKTILKSLVISSPNGMTVDRLNRDYKETVGEWIPFKKLGYQNLELFLKSVPDTLVLTGHGREAMVGFVCSEKTQHINELIKKQKNTTRDRKAAMRLQPALSNSHSIPARPTQNKVFNQPVSKVYCTYNPKPIPINSYVHLYQPQQNVYLQNLYQQNLYHQNLLQQQLYQQCYQPNFQSKPKSFLPEKSNPQINRTTSNVNIRKSQPPSTDSKINFNQTDINKKTPAINVDKSSISLKEKNTKSLLSEPKDPKSIFVDVQNSNNTLPRNDNLKNSIEDKNNSNESSNKATCSKTSAKIIFPSKSNVKEMKSDKSVAPNNKSRHEVELSCSKNKSDTSLKVQVQQKNTTALQTNPKNSSDSLIKFPSVPIKFSTKKKLTEKIIKRPELPTVSELQALIHPKPKSADPDVTSLVSKTSSTVDNVNKSRYITDPFSTMDSSDNDIDEAIPEFAADYRVFHVDFPENTVPFGKKIPSVQLPKDFTKGAVIGVFISEIHSPFKFWFHPHKENHELDVLMSGIESFYERLGDADLLIPKSCITPGQVCVALYNDMWHRAEILSTVTKNNVKVLFVDYGTVSKVEICHIKYLQNRFAETPAQAIRGSLSHIKPISQVWHKRAIQEFLSLVAEIFLYAQIVEIDENESTVYMVLCDTNSGQTIQINKLLVDRGFARLDSEWDENKIKQNGYRKRHPRDIFPTFEMLETGEYPSLYELEQLLAQGIDYEKITDKIILSNLSNHNLHERYSSHVEKMSFNLLDTNPFKSDIISEIVSLKMFDK
ncbi:tudor domain-containing protein 5 [Eupeodes corollae]|uniref:tudor domain-containing protein 5 n=1 Tax=Eupeodes corollae TaxID=290404 RepID=UPI0024906394|nr:tudor domain-containing protein 5 [Eupeodes corollae]